MQGPIKGGLYSTPHFSGTRPPAERRVMSPARRARYGWMGIHASSTRAGRQRNAARGSKGGSKGERNGERNGMRESGRESGEGGREGG